MSLQTWKEEFYPTEAYRATEQNAIEHSLTKWRGLTQENLEKHGLKRSRTGIYDEERVGRNFLEIDDRSCSLCIVYRNIQDVFIEKKRVAAGLPIPTTQWCDNCPIKLTTGEDCCTGDLSPYMVYVEEGRPQKMIRLLEEVAERVDFDRENRDCSP